MNNKRTTKTCDRPFYRRATFLTLVSVGVLLVSLLIALPYGIGYGIKQGLLANGAREVSIGNVDFNPFLGRLRVQQLQVAGGPDAGLELPLLDLTLGWRPLAQRRIDIEALTIRGVDLSVERLTDGALRVGGITLPTAANDESDSGPGWGFGIERLGISDGRIRYRDPQLDTQARITSLQLTHLTSWEPTRPARLTLDGALDRARLWLDGQFTAFADTPGFSTRLRLDPLELKPAAALLRSTLTSFSGRLSVDSTWNGELEPEGALHLTQQGRITFTGLHLVGTPGEFVHPELAWQGNTELTFAAERLDLTAKGRLVEQAARVEPADTGMTYQDAGISLEGELKLSRGADLTRVRLQAELEQKGLDLRRPEQATRVRHELLHWSGELNLEDGAQGTEIVADGVLKLQSLAAESGARTLSLGGMELTSHPLKLSLRRSEGGIDLAHGGSLTTKALVLHANGNDLTQQALRWQGDLALKTADQRLDVNARGRLQGQELAVETERPNLALAGKGLDWQGKVDYSRSDDRQRAAIQGELRLDPLRADAPQEKFTLVAFDSLGLEGLDITTDADSTAAALRFRNINLAKQTGAEPTEGESPPVFLHSEVTDFEGIHFSPTTGLHIESIKEQNVRTLIRRDAEGKLNAIRFIDIFRRVLASDQADAEQAPTTRPLPTGAATTPAQPAAEPRKLAVRVDQGEVSGDNLLLFHDEFVDPPYLAKLHITKLKISDFDSSRPDQASPFQLQAKIGKYATLNLDGELYLLGQPVSADISGRLEGLALPPLSSYTNKALGYRLTSGQLDADIAVRIDKGKLSGDNKLLLHEPEVSKLTAEELKKYQVKSPLPLGTGLAVLRNDQGDIELEIPVSGDLNNPKFDPSDAINQAIAKGMQQGARTYLAAALFPFGTLITVAEIAGKAAMEIRLDPVTFSPASSTLDGTAREYLEKVAEVLEQRPQMDLKICGRAVASDREALSRLEAAKLKAAAKAKRGDGKAAKEKNGRTGSKAAAPAAITDQRLIALATERATRVKDHLIKRHGIKANRLIACRPKIDEQAKAPKPRVDLLL